MTLKEHFERIVADQALIEKFAEECRRFLSKRESLLDGAYCREYRERNSRVQQVLIKINTIKYRLNLALEHVERLERNPFDYGIQEWYEKKH